MKRKLTLTIDERILPEAKRFAKRKETSLSQLIEQLLRETRGSETPTFSSRWRGKFRAAQRSEERYRQLAEKYL